MERLQHQPEYTTRTTCRVCDSPQLKDVLSLGNQHLVGFNHSDTPVIPLELIQCGDCRLVQLRHTTRADLMWNEHYGYRSGVNQTMRDELTGIVRSIEGIVGLNPKEIVVDIGCNDGTLLDAYKQDVVRVGYDPSQNVANYAIKTLAKYGVERYKVILDYFDKNSFIRNYGMNQARAVTAIAMFYDLEDPNAFMENIKAAMSKNGVFVVQQNYLGGMIQQGAFDNICHEHLEYYSLASMEVLMARHGLEIFDVSENGINGGSFRTYIRFKGMPVGNREGKLRVDDMRAREARLGLNSESTYKEFGEMAKLRANSIGQFVRGEVEKGKKIMVYGASTRGNVLLQSCELDSRWLVAAADRNPDKWGKTTAGTNIPIISEEEARQAKPDYFLVLPYFFRDEFIKREQEYLNQGGKLIFPLPEFCIIEK